MELTYLRISMKHWPVVSPCNEWIVFWFTAMAVLFRSKDVHRHKGQKREVKVILGLSLFWLKNIPMMQLTKSTLSVGQRSLSSLKLEPHITLARPPSEVRPVKGRHCFGRQCGGLRRTTTCLPHFVLTQSWPKNKEQDCMEPTMSISPFACFEQVFKLLRRLWVLIFYQRPTFVDIVATHGTIL